MVALCQQPTAKKLIVKVIKARHLEKTGFVGKADPYVKVSMWHKGKMVAKTKTDTIKNTQDPVFNKTVFFDLPELDAEGLKNIKLEFTVMDEDWGKDDLIGRLVIGGENCAGSALHHWNKIIASPLAESEVWHPLSEFGDTPETTKPVIEEKEPPVTEVDEKEPHEAKKPKPPAVSLYLLHSFALLCIKYLYLIIFNVFLGMYF